MIIKSLSGKILVQTGHKTVRRTLEHCAAESIALEGADLRKAKLSMAALDGLKARGASFWGADLTGADLGFANLKGCDFRAADFKDSCLAHSDLRDADMRGAYFSGTLIEGAIFDNALISCPSFWQCDVQSAKSFKGMVFTHLGEREITIEEIPLVVRGLPKDMVLHKDLCQWGRGLYPAGLLPKETCRALFLLKTRIDRMLCGFSRNAIHPIQKTLR